MKTLMVAIVVEDNDTEWAEKIVWEAADEFTLPVCSIETRDSTQEEKDWAETEARLADEEYE